MDDQQNRMLDRKRNNMRIIWKTLMITTSLASIAVTIYMAIFMKQLIDYRNSNGVMSSNFLHSGQNIDQGQFDSFGPHLEQLWRAFLIANLILILLYCSYIPLATLWHQYYVIILFVIFMFNEVVLAFGTEYFSVPYHLATGVYFLTAVVGHGLCHSLRLDILDEMNAIKENNRQ